MNTQTYKWTQSMNTQKYKWTKSMNTQKYKWTKSMNTQTYKWTKSMNTQKINDKHVYRGMKVYLTKDEYYMSRCEQNEDEISSC